MRYCDIGGADIKLEVPMISGTAISDTISCDITTPDITSDIDSDIGGVVL